MQNYSAHSIYNQLFWASSILDKSSDSPRIDAELLLCHVIKKTRVFLITWPEKSLSETEIATFHSIVQKRRNGEPVAYLIGKRDFWTMTLSVTQHTLIPRPETELLIETALACFSTEPPKRVLELGTGTGAIALSLAKEWTNCQIVATDISPETLSVAKQNATTNQIEHIQFIESNWFHHFSPEESFDLIISNPPYISDTDPHLLKGDVRFEPKRALTSGMDGLDAIREIIKESPKYLTPQGHLILEHGYDQGEQTTALLKNAKFNKVRCLKDYSGNDRCSIGTVGKPNKQFNGTI